MKLSNNRASDISLIGPQHAAEHSSPVVTENITQVSRSRPGQGGLFRKYLLLFIGLVSAALLLNAGIEVVFNYRENQIILEHLQREKADAAAQRIAQFIGEIERQVGWTTLARGPGQPAALTSAGSTMCGCCAKCRRSPSSARSMQPARSS